MNGANGKLVELSRVETIAPDPSYEAVLKAYPDASIEVSGVLLRKAGHYAAFGAKDGDTLTFLDGEPTREKRRELRRKIQEGIAASGKIGFESPDGRRWGCEYEIAVADQDSLNTGPLDQSE